MDILDTPERAAILVTQALVSVVTRVTVEAETLDTADIAALGYRGIADILECQVIQVTVVAETLATQDTVGSEILDTVVTLVLETLVTPAIVE